VLWSLRTMVICLYRSDHMHSKKQCPSSFLQELNTWFCFFS
jgi:hypothetical protein